MTKEEAITILNRQIDDDPFARTEYRKQVHEALNMGIKALEQKPSEDTISRQAVLSKFKEVCFSKEWVQFRIDYGSHGQRDFLINYIEQLPSITPHYTDVEIQKMQEMEQAEIQKAYELGKASQKKTGHWIDDCGGAKCSCCGYCIDDYYYVKTYCPNCGLKMEREAEE